MMLSLKDRFTIPVILPTTGSFTKIVVKNDIIEKIKITQEEIKKFKIESEGDIVKWNTENENEIDIEFTELEVNLLKECLQKLDSEEKLNDETFNLYKKLIK